MLITRKFKEGGNLTVNGKTGEHSATKLRIKDMSLDQYSSFKKDFISFLYGINERFEDEYGYPVWEKPELLQTGRMFSGSTRTLFTKEFEEYSARKPKIGDFDIQVPEACFEDFHKFILEEMVDQSVGDWTIYGCSKSPGQDHSLVQADKNYPNVDAEYLQIDWEYVPFTNGEPTEFATFAHYSSWEDLGHNIKGAFRQKLVRALTSTVDERENVVIVSEKTGKPRGQFTKGGIVHFMGYSVDKGVRTKFKPYLDENGNQVMIDGKEAWYEAPTKDSYYEQDMGAIFQLIFGYEPTEKDKRDLFSFVRTVNYLMKSLDEERVRKVFKLYIADIWGPAGQRLSAFDPNEDREWKTTSCNEFIKAFPYLKEYLPEIQEMQKTYYNNYKTMEKK